MAPSLPTPTRRKKLQGEPDFERPPLWIHAPMAAFLATRTKREAKRRELLALLDRIPLRSGDK